jgi:hypothetical protein
MKTSVYNIPGRSRKLKGLFISIIICYWAVTIISCSERQATISERTIDVESAMSEVGTLKASDYFKKIRYVPLETTDSSLIGNMPILRVIGDKLLITTAQKQAILFDKNTGAFLCSVGHVGNDPQGYSSPQSCFVDEQNELIYFKCYDDHFVIYNTKGEFVERIASPYNPIGSFTFAVNALNADTLLTYYTDVFGTDDERLIFFDRSGEEFASATVANRGTAQPFEIASISVLRDDDEIPKTYGKGADFGFISVEGKDPDLVCNPAIAGPRFWHTDGATYLKIAYNDTIYRIEGDTLSPALVLNLGKYHWDIEKRSMKNQDGNIVPTKFLDSRRYLCFRFLTGLFHPNNIKPYIAMYDKKSGRVRIGMDADGLTDDLTKFLPLQPMAVSSNGEYVGLITIEDIEEWFDLHKNITDLPAEIRSLRSLATDSNPIAVWME